MEQSFKFAFSRELTARAIKVQQGTDLSVALKKIGLHPPRPVLVVIGGASKLSDADLARVRSLFVEALAPLAKALGAIVVDGGTDAGVMRLMGQARAAIAAKFPLVGVTPVGLATLPHSPSSSPEASPLEPHHTHFVLVPGSSWGDESPWLSRVASTLSGKVPSAVVLVNGGEITWKDVSYNVKANRPVIVVAGSGRVADILAAALRGKITDERARELVASGLLRTVDLKEGSHAIADVLAKMLSAKAG